MPLFRVQSQSLRTREIPRGEEGERRFKNEAISEGEGVAFRGVFPEALGNIGELLKSNSCSIEQAVSYFQRSFIYRRLNVFWNNTNLSSEAHVPTPRYGQYLTHAHSHITRLVAVMDSFYPYWGSSGLWVCSCVRFWPYRNFVPRVRVLPLSSGTRVTRTLGTRLAIPRSWYVYLSAYIGVQCFFFTSYAIVYNNNKIIIIYLFIYL